MGSQEKKLRRQAALRAAKARSEHRPQMSLEESLDALSGGIQEAFVRIARLEKEISQVLEEHDQRLTKLVEDKVLEQRMERAEQRVRGLIQAIREGKGVLPPFFCEECGEVITEGSPIFMDTDENNTKRWWHHACHLKENTDG